MIYWMCSYTRLDRLRNEIIREKIKVAPIEDKLRESTLRWFSHVKKKRMDAPGRRCNSINLHLQKG